MIYILDNGYNLLKIIPEEDVLEWTYTVELNSFDQANFSLPADYELDLWKQGKYFGFFHREVFRLFRIIANKVNEEREISGLDVAESDLRTVKIIEDRRPQHVTADQAVRVALEGTGYEVGEAQGLTLVRSTNFYYISPREALVKVIEGWGCEFRTRYSFVGNRVQARYIDLYQRQGVATGRQFVYGDNLLSVEYEQSEDEVLTALIGLGKGEQTENGGHGRRITFADVVWSRANGDPVDKPEGSKAVFLSDKKEAYGIVDQASGQILHRIGVFIDEDIEDPAQLLKRTYDQLLTVSEPARVFKADILAISADVWLGDRVGIIRDDVGIAFEARVSKLVIDKLNFDQSTVTLGDYETLKAGNRQALQSAIREAVDSQSEIYDANLEALNREIEAKMAQKNAEFDEAMRLRQLEMDNAMVLAEQKAKDYADTLKTTIDSQINAVNQSLAEQERDQAAKVAEVLEKANANADLASQAKVASDQAKSQAAQALADALRAKSEAIAEAERLTRETEASLSLDINQTKESLTSLAKKTDLDTLKQTVTNQATTISQQADSLRLKAESWQVSQLNDRVAGNTAELGVLAGEIRTKLTRTEVDDLVTAKGFATATTVQNLVRETAEGYERKLTETRGLIPRELGAVNLVRNSKIAQSSNAYGFADRTVRLEAGRTYWLTVRAKKTGGTTEKKARVYLYKSDWSEETKLEFTKTSYETKHTAFTVRAGGDYLITSYWSPSGGDRSGTADVDWYMVTEGDMPSLTWSPAPEDLVTETAFHEVRDTVASHTRTIADQGQSISQVVQTASGLVSRVQGLENDVVREADVAITPGRIQLTARKSIDTQTVANMFSVDDKMISAVANRFVITGQNYNLVDKDKQVSFSPPGRRDTEISPWYTDRLEAGDEFVASYHLTRLSTGATTQAQTLLHLQYTDGSQDWQHPQSSQVGNREDVLRVPTTGKTVSRYRFLFQQNGWSSFSTYRVAGLTIRKKTSASLLVDGSITSRHLASGSVETGHLTAGSITGSHIQANAISGQHIVADQALFTKLAANEAYLAQLFAKQAFINQVQTVDIQANRIKTGVLQAVGGSTKFDLNQGYIELNTNQAAIRRKIINSNYPTQFIKFALEGNAALTIMGANRDGTETYNSDSFGGILIKNGPGTEEVKVLGDIVKFQTGHSNDRRWEMNTVAGNDRRQVHLYPAGSNLTESVITTTRLEVSEIYIQTGRGRIRLKDILNKWNGYFSSHGGTENQHWWHAGF